MELEDVMIFVEVSGTDVAVPIAFTCIHVLALSR